MIDATEKYIINTARSLIKRRETIAQQVAIAEATLRQASIAVNDARRLHEDTLRIIDERTNCFPWLADAIAQYHELCDLKVAEFLEQKLHPAKSAAERVRELAAEKRKCRREYILARNRVRYYESLFPHLRDYVGEDLDDLVKSIGIDAAEPTSDDPVREWVSAADYARLTEDERNQRALDRYLARGKSSWEVGREYERYVGYGYEQCGYRVKYNGATEGLGDLGRDLIAQQGSEVLIVQCKYWRQEKQVREKHVFQLYGTCVEYWLKNGGKSIEHRPLLFPEPAAVGDITPVLVTSATLSPEARDCARKLGVAVRENQPLLPYPVIKCNIAKNGERIYHLPFDQQYDRAVIDPARGEMHVETVAEATEHGFRRAWRWRSGA